MVVVVVELVVDATGVYVAGVMADVERLGKGHPKQTVLVQVYGTLAVWAHLGVWSGQPHIGSMTWTEVHPWQFMAL